MPSYDSYVHEPLGRPSVECQWGVDKKTYRDRRRVPFQPIAPADSTQQGIQCFPFLDPARNPVRSEGFSPDCLDWIDLAE